MAAWRAAYGGLLPDELLARLDGGGRRQMWEMVVSDPSTRSMLLVAHELSRLTGFVQIGRPETVTTIPPRRGRCTCSMSIRLSGAEVSAAR